MNQRCRNVKQAVRAYHWYTEQRIQTTKVLCTFPQLHQWVVWTCTWKHIVKIHINSKFAAVTKSGPVIISKVGLQSHNTKVFLWGMTLTAGGTWGDCVGVLKRCDWGHPMRLLQPRVTMATVSLLHGAEWFLPVDTPKTHGAEGWEEKSSKRGKRDWGRTSEGSRRCSCLTRRLLPLSCAPRL